VENCQWQRADALLLRHPNGEPDLGFNEFYPKPENERLNKDLIFQKMNFRVSRSLIPAIYRCGIKSFIKFDKL
jgi:hypothetical protein